MIDRVYNRYQMANAIPPGHETMPIFSSIRRRWEEAYSEGKYPSRVRLDSASHEALCKEMSSLFGKDIDYIAEILTLSVVIVDEPEWLEVL